MAGLKLNRAKPLTEAKARPTQTNESVLPQFSSKGPPPIALFELASIAFIYGLGSPEYQAAAEKRAAEQSEKRLWK